MKVSPCKYWWCEPCKKVFYKEELESRMQLYSDPDSAGMIAGTRSCGGCGTRYPVGHIYAGAYDVPVEFWNDLPQPVLLPGYAPPEDIFDAAFNRAFIKAESDRATEPAPQAIAEPVRPATPPMELEEARERLRQLEKQMAPAEKAAGGKILAGFLVVVVVALAGWHFRDRISPRSVGDSRDPNVRVQPHHFQGAPKNNR